MIRPEIDERSLCPVLTPILLTLLVSSHLARSKVRAYADHQADTSRSAIHAGAWPDPVRGMDNDPANQFHVLVALYVPGSSPGATPQTPGPSPPTGAVPTIGGSAGHPMERSAHRSDTTQSSASLS